MTTNNQPPVCDITVVDHDQLAILAKDVFERATEVVVTPDGFDLLFEERSEDFLINLGKFVAYDSLCCTFMGHSMVVEPVGGPVHLGLTVDEAAHAMTATEVGRLVRPEVAEAAGLTSAGSGIPVRDS